MPARAHSLLFRLFMLWFGVAGIGCASPALGPKDEIKYRDELAATTNTFLLLFEGHPNTAKYAPTDAYACELLCYICDRKWGFKQIKPFFHRQTSSHGIIARTEHTVVLAFCDTDYLNSRDWLSNMRTKLVSPKGSADSKLLVHEGFSEAVDQIEFSSLEDTVRAYIGEGDEKRSLWLMGHSRGGAMAVIAAERLARDGIKPKEIYTFGQPKATNDQLDSAVLTRYNIILHRVVNHLDPVADWPTSDKYAHGGTPHVLRDREYLPLKSADQASLFESIRLSGLPQGMPPPPYLRVKREQ